MKKSRFTEEQIIFALKGTGIFRPATMPVKTGQLCAVSTRSCTVLLQQTTTHCEITACRLHYGYRNVYVPVCSSILRSCPHSGRQHLNLKVIYHLVG